jgi:hypothetical protein
VWSRIAQKLLGVDSSGHAEYSTLMPFEVNHGERCASSAVRSWSRADHLHDREGDAEEKSVQASPDVVFETSK